jgi:hypothetical protein
VPVVETRGPKRAIARAAAERKFSLDLATAAAVPRALRPSTVDWRNHQGLNAVTAVGDQGLTCGSCVGFATIGLLESMLLIEHGIRADLSEAEFFFCGFLADCAWGWMEGTAVARARNEGAVVESVAPYTGMAAPCPTVPNRAAVRVTASSDIAFSNDESRKLHLNAVGPMIACFDVYEDFDAYPGGVYTHVTGDYRGGHCVLVIGYDDTLGCWICKNSWGTGWGEAGFFRIAYGQCNIDGAPFRGLSGMRLGDRWQVRRWADRFAGTNATDLLTYNGVTHVWSLGTLRNGLLTFSDVGDTTNFGDLADGRPTWVGTFLGAPDRQVMFMAPQDGNWWLGDLQGSQLVWSLAGNTQNFGQVADGRPFWQGYFSALDRHQLVFYHPSDDNWWLGTVQGGQLQWSLAGNTAGFGPLADGRPFWVGDFDADGLDELLFHSPGDRNWWLGSVINGTFQWTLVGNTTGFGNVADGRPFWTGYFRGVFRTDLLFYSPGDRNWWLGTLQGTQLQWSLVGNTANFGQIGDGRPIWIDDFTGSGGTDVLFYSPGDQNWWLGTMQGTQLQWSQVGNTSGFGQVWDGRPFHEGRFTGGYGAELLFHYPPDGSWWLGKMQGGQLGWQAIADTTGLIVFR